MNATLFQWHSLKTRVTLFTLTIFVVSLWALSFFASRMLREDMQSVLGEQQFSTVSAMAHEINDRMSTRIQSLETIAKEVTPAMLGDSAALQTRLEQRSLLLETIAESTVFSSWSHLSDRASYRRRCFRSAQTS